MNTTNPVSGRCLCGAVSLSIPAPPPSLAACHCSMCRRWGGGPLLAVDCGQGVMLDGAQHLTVYESSDWAERGFCRHCGTHLFYRTRDGHHYHVPVGLFDALPDPLFDTQIFIDEKPAYYRFANDTRDMTGAEVFALYAPKADA